MARPPKPLAPPRATAASSRAPRAAEASEAAAGPPPAVGAAARADRDGSRTPPPVGHIGRLAHIPRAGFRSLPSVWNSEGRLNADDWIIDCVELGADGALLLRFISRTPEGDTAAGPPRLRVLSLSTSLLDAAVAVRLRPGGVIEPPR